MNEVIHINETEGTARLCVPADEPVVVGWVRVATLEEYNHWVAAHPDVVPPRLDEDEAEGQQLVSLWSKFQDNTVTVAEQRRVLKWLFKIELRKRGLL